MKLIVMTILMGVATLANAQTADQSQTRERKGATPIAQNAEDLAKQLDIPQDQADKTWALYSEYNTKKEATREKRMEEIKTRRANKEELNDAEIEKAFYDNIKSQRDALDMDEAYFKKFMEVLPANKSVKLMRQIRMAKHQDRNMSRDKIPAAPEPQDRLSK